jgi:hypothetical protein
MPARPVGEDRRDDHVVAAPAGSSSQSTASGVWAPSRTPRQRSSSHRRGSRRRARSLPRTPVPPAGAAGDHGAAGGRGTRTRRPAGRRSRTPRRRVFGGDCSRVSPSTSVCLSPTLVRGRRARRDVRRVVRSAELRLDRGGGRTPRANGERAAVSVSTARTERLGNRHARDCAREGRVGVEPLVPAPRRGDVRRPTGSCARSPAPRSTSLVPTTHRLELLRDRWAGQQRADVSVPNPSWGHGDSVRATRRRAHASGLSVRAMSVAGTADGLKGHQPGIPRSRPWPQGR